MSQDSTVNNSESSKRDPSQYPAVNIETIASLTQINPDPSKRPKKVVLGSDGSTFDLWENGLMHLEWNTGLVFVYLFIYVGIFEDESIYVYKEDSPDGWIWYIYPDGRLYYYYTQEKNKEVRQYDSNARQFERLP
ncbi:MAG: hypothetical protein AAFY16_03185 [Cyanobacteria bacterium J06642_3]